jgi:hypothetical protein
MTESDTDGLRARLSRIDPVGPDVPVDPATSPRAAELMERAVQSAEVSSPVDPSPLRRRRRGPVLWGAAAAAAAATAVGIFVAVDDGGSGEEDRATTLALSLPAGDVMSSCLAFDVAVLRDMPLAFAGTVTAADAGRVTLDVDHWYTGGDADQVALAVPDGQTSAALDGVDFRTGERYLVTATDGTVNGCGYSGPATSQLEDAFSAAFDS